MLRRRVWVWVKPGCYGPHMQSHHRKGTACPQSHLQTVYQRVCGIAGRQPAAGKGLQPQRHVLVLQWLAEQLYRCRQAALNSLCRGMWAEVGWVGVC